MFFSNLFRDMVKGVFWIPRIENLVSPKENNNFIIALTENGEAEKINKEWRLSWEKAFSIEEKNFFYVYLFNGRSSRKAKRIFVAEQGIKDQIEQNLI